MPRPNSIVLAVAFCSFSLFVSPLVAGITSPCTDTPTVITVDTSDDPDPTLLSKSCTFTGNSVSPSADGLCSLRRAILEASARRDDLPITIAFDLLESDSRYDGATQTWSLLIDQQLPVLQTTNDLDNTGCVTIDGTTQPQAGNRTLPSTPKIFLDDEGDLAGWSLQISSEYNVIRGLGFQGGTNISLLRQGGGAGSAHSTLIEQVWIGLTADGQNLSFQSTGSEVSLAVASGVNVRTDNNIIRNSVITGAFGRAINIDSNTTNTVIENVHIGTRGDGTLPAVQSTDPGTVACEASMSYNPSANWYGGWGIALSGSGHQITGNTIAGLQNMRSANDTAPVAIEVFGNDHLIQDNVIGRDTNGLAVGVCGHAIKVAGQGTDVLDNVIQSSRTSFLATRGGGDVIDAAILYNEDNLGDNGEVTVRRNLVFDGPGDIYQFGPVVPDALRLFAPPVITDITGIAITGTSGAGSQCGLCTIDFYLDDDDSTQDALQYLGSTVADAGGDFTFQLTERLPLSEDSGIRVSATTENSGVIAGFGVGTTTKFSDLFQEATEPALFEDDFEFGNTTRWTKVVGGS